MRYKILGWQGYWAELTHQNMPKQPILNQAERTKQKRPTTQTAHAHNGPKHMFNVLHPLSCVKAVTDATEPIAASLILNIAIQEPLSSADKISRKFGPRSGPTKCLKLIHPDFYHTHSNPHVQLLFKKI